MSVKMILENQLFRRYVLNKTSALGILFGAFAAIGLDHNRIAEAKLYFISGIFAWSFLSETGIWFLMSAVGGLAFVRIFSPASNVWSQLLAWSCLCSYGIFSSIVFFLDSAAREFILTNWHWISYLPSVSITSGLASLILTRWEFAESVKAWLSQYLRRARP
jgi:hypothetical protein